MLTSREACWQAAQNIRAQAAQWAAKVRPQDAAHAGKAAALAQLLADANLLVLALEPGTPLHQLLGAYETVEQAKRQYPELTEATCRFEYVAAAGGLPLVTNIYFG